LIACQIVCFVSSCSNLYIKSAMFGMRPMVLAMIVLSGAAGYLIYGL
jgi:predicted RecB family endonuclease